MKKPNLAKKSKERIIEATLNIIQKQGIDEVSIRKIASSAKVNIASINYYYGSKENVINEVIQYLMGRVNKVFLILDDTKISPEKRLTEFINNFIDNIASCPVAFKGSTCRMIKDEILPAELITSMRENYQKLRGAVKELASTDDDELVTMKMFQLLSSVIYPVAIGEYAYKLSGVDLTQPEPRKKYISLVIKSIK